MSDWKRGVRQVLISTSNRLRIRQCEIRDLVASILTTLNSGDSGMVLLRSLLLMLFAVSTLVGCGGGEASTGHTEDKTPGGEATPPLMDDAAMNAYSAEQGAKANGQQ